MVGRTMAKAKLPGEKKTVRGGKKKGNSCHSTADEHLKKALGGPSSSLGGRIQKNDKLHKDWRQKTEAPL